MLWGQVVGGDGSLLLEGFPPLMDRAGGGEFLDSWSVAGGVNFEDLGT